LGSGLVIAVLALSSFFYSLLVWTQPSGGEQFSFSSVLIISTVAIVLAALVSIFSFALQMPLGKGRYSAEPFTGANHTLLLGWSPSIFTIISELAITNIHKKDPIIVILGDKDPDEMENEVRRRAQIHNSTLIFLKGCPSDPLSLVVARPSHARSIIVLPTEGAHPDGSVLNTLLALTRAKDAAGQRLHVVAQLQEQKSMEAAQLICGDELELILAGDFLARVAVQTCRQPGLSVVYQELLDFDGDEIYFKEEMGIEGKTFAEILVAYDDSAVIGLRKSDGTILLNPPMVHRASAGDKVIVISKDELSIQLSGLIPTIDRSAINNVPPKPRGPERSLILGWNSRVPLIIGELDQYVSENSDVTVLCARPEAESILAKETAGLERQRVNFICGDHSSREMLESISVHAFHHIIVVGDGEGVTFEQTDATTLLTLLHLRNIATEHGHTYSIVSEMLDIRNEELAQVLRPDDLIVSHRLVSLLMSQISENKELSVVFSELFRPEGSEIYLKPANEYVKLDKPLNFYTVIEAARRKNEVAIGYRLEAAAAIPEEHYGVHVNPRKSEEIEFRLQDKIIVLAVS